MFTRVFSADLSGIDAYKVSVEADVSAGLPVFSMVGLLAPEVKEAKERVQRAITNSGIDLPARKITINMSPADIRKHGTGFDLPIAVAILSAMGLINQEALEGRMFVGELSLDGSIKRVNGILPIALCAREEKIKELVVPQDNAFEGCILKGLKICGSSDIKSLINQLNENSMDYAEYINLEEMLNASFETDILDYSDIKGQEKAKRATVVAASGFHNILYIGPPGSGKSMMAKRMPGIFGRLTEEESLEISRIYSVLGMLPSNSLILKRPFRSPHHTVTPGALVGGNNNPRPGEITLAHKGVLFLDEVAEFPKATIELLRQPLEDKCITISRLRSRITFPADCMLVMAMNPCKCGYYPDRNICKCTQNDVDRYFGKIRGPVLDRIDICVGTQKLKSSEFCAANTMSTKTMRNMVLNARANQENRFRDDKILYNSQMNKTHIEKYCKLTDDTRLVLNKVYDRYNLTARGYYKILKVARTIADIDGCEEILSKHILEAAGYRNNYLAE